VLPGEEVGLSSEPVTAGDEVITGHPSYAPPELRAAADPTTIGKSLRIKGEVIGSESLYIDGKVEGSINLLDCRVTVGRHAQVLADITAREVVVLGTVHGNVNASDRVDIRSFLRRYRRAGIEASPQILWVVPPGEQIIRYLREAQQHGLGVNLHVLVQTSV
jgi:hypothetical protein